MRNLDDNAKALSEEMAKHVKGADFAEAQRVMANLVKEGAELPQGKSKLSGLMLEDIPPSRAFVSNRGIFADAADRLMSQILPLSGPDCE